MNITYCEECKHFKHSTQYIGSVKVEENYCDKGVLKNPKADDFCSRSDSIVSVVEKCSFPYGVTIKPDGVNELDACVYEDIERYINVTVTVSKCKKCGDVDISWIKQDDTERIF